MMHPANTWTVEFAAREHQAREQRTPVVGRRDSETCRFDETPGLNTPRGMSIDRFLLVIGSWISRHAGHGTNEPLGNRRVQPGTPS